MTRIPLPRIPWQDRTERWTGRFIEINFITLHYAYFILTSLITALILWGSSNPARSINFTDCLFLTTSAMTEAGLNTVNLSALTVWQQFILFGLVMCGSAIFVSAFVVFVRMKRFEKVFQHVVQERKAKRQNARRGGFTLRRTKPLTVKEEEEKNTPVIPSEPKSSTFVIPGSRDFAEGTLDEKDTESSSDLGHQQPNGDVTTERPQRPRVTINDPKPTAQNGSPTVNPEKPSHLSRSETQQSRMSRASHASSQEPRSRPFISFTGVGASANATLRHRVPTMGARPPLQRAPTTSSSLQSRTMPFHSAAGWVGRNSQIHGLTIEERQKLGGFEYSALMFLSFIVPFYLFIWQFLGCLALGAWVNNIRPELPRDNGSNPWWMGSFNAVSAFNNSGMSLLDANMVAFQDSYFMLLSMGLFILAGNTAYPIFLRGAVWTVWKVVDSFPDKEFWENDRSTLRFLLDHPRRCYTNMFPSKHTWWLAGAVVLLNVVDWAAFEILNIGNNQIDDFSGGERVVDGLFQAIAVRSGGFYVVAIPTVRVSLQILYMVMMYISVYPVAITMRNSNVYEESSLGIFAEDMEDSEAKEAISDAAGVGRAGRLKRSMTKKLGNIANAPHREEHSTFVRQQIRAQLSHDTWAIALAVFLIMIVENSNFQHDPVNFSVFNVLFEVVSAYSCVGITVGAPGQAYSFCGAWHKLSKLILIAVMIRGRHRGLPVAIDRAVQLPGGRSWDAEQSVGGEDGGGLRTPVDGTAVNDYGAPMSPIGEAEPQPFKRSRTLRMERGVG